MKTKTILLIGCIGAIIASCIPSIYPLYRQKDLLLDDRLPGYFSTEEEGDYWQFSRLDISNPESLQGGWKHYQSGKTYKLSVMEEGVVEEFAAHLLKLGDHYYLDFVPVNYRIYPDLLEVSLAPSHIFARAELGEEYLVLHFFDPDWLYDLIEGDQIRISYLERGDRYILNAQTDELQKFILKFANDSTTFMDADTLPRIYKNELANL